MTRTSIVKGQRLLVTLGVALTAIGCAQNIAPIGDPATEDGESNPTSNNSTISEPTGGEWDLIGREFSAVIDASDYELWVYLDLETGLIVNPVDPDSGDLVNIEAPEANMDWDLAFQRFKVKTNGGISGNGEVEGIRIDEVDFESVSEAPVDGYIVDLDDSDDLDTDPDYVFLGESPWYDYAGAPTHALTPADAIYVLRSVDGNYFKLQFTGYYDAPPRGTSGFPAFRWAGIKGPAPDATTAEDERERGGEDDDAPEEEDEGPPELLPGQLDVDMSDSDSAIYISLASHLIVDPEDPAASTDWDVAIQGARILTNGGMSGPGFGAAREATAGGWNALMTASTIGYMDDDETGNPVLNQWAVDDSDVRTPRDVVFVVRTAAGDYAKLEVLNYLDGIYSLRIEMLERSVTVQSTTLDASEGAVYVDFLSGTQVEPQDPESDLQWDFAIVNGHLQTNGGTSGPGEGAADTTDAMTLDEVVSVSDGQGCYVFNTHKCDCDMSFPQCTEAGEIWTGQCPCDSTFVVDEESTEGGSAISSNPAMSGWHDGDASRWPSAQVLVLRTRLSAYVKLLITEHDSGVFDIDWAFSGAGQSTF